MDIWAQLQDEVARHERAKRRNSIYCWVIGTAAACFVLGCVIIAGIKSGA